MEGVLRRVPQSTAWPRPLPAQRTLPGTAVPSRWQEPEPREAGGPYSSCSPPSDALLLEDREHRLAHSSTLRSGEMNVPISGQSWHSRRHLCVWSDSAALEVGQLLVPQRHCLGGSTVPLAVPYVPLGARAPACRAPLSSPAAPGGSSKWIYVKSPATPQDVHRSKGHSGSLREGPEMASRTPSCRWVPSCPLLSALLPGTLPSFLLALF